MGQRPYFDPESGVAGSIEHDPNCRHPSDQRTRVGGCGDGCCTDYRCGACDTTFRFEWPD
jgi:hypothetical protein